MSRRAAASARAVVPCGGVGVPACPCCRQPHLRLLSPRARHAAAGRLRCAGDARPAPALIAASLFRADHPSPPLGTLPFSAHVRMRPDPRAPPPRRRAKARGGVGRLIVELASTSSTFGLAGLGATERFLEVARAVLPHPRRYKLAWSTQLGGKPLYIWRPIAPSAGYVSLGFVATTTEDEPAPSAVHCIPARWCVESRAPVRLVAEAGGVGASSRPGSLWTVNAAGLLGATAGHARPTEPFYDLREDIFRLENHRPDRMI